MFLSQEGIDLGGRLLIDGAREAKPAVDIVRKYFDESVVALSDESLNMLMMVMCSLALQEPATQDL